MDIVSVIVPVYNVEQYLERCVQSIVSQSYTALEIILIDDGAKDRSPEICDRLATRDSRIKVVHQTNMGLGLTRNTGLKYATGAFVTFIDSDDYIGERHIEDLHSAISQNDADAVLGFYSSVNQNGVVTAKENKLKPGLYNKERIFREILLPLFGTEETCPYDAVVESSCCMNLYRTSIINENNIRFTSEKEAVAEDQFFNIDFCMKSNRVAVAQVNDYFYYENPQSISRKYDPNRFTRTVNYYHLLWKKALTYEILELTSNRIKRSFLMKSRVAIRHIVLSDMDFGSKKIEIRRILNHELMERVLKEYPIHMYPVHMKMLMILMRGKWVYGVYCLIKIREYMRKAKSLIKSLK